MMANPATRKSLMKCMRNLLRRKPFSAVTVDEICALARVSRRTFYRYYQDKFDLLNDIYRTQFFEKIPIRDDWNTWDYHYLLCKQIYQDITFFRHAFDVQGQNGFWEGCRGLLAPLIHKDYENSGLDGDFLSDFMERDTDWLFHSTSQWLAHSPVEPPETFSARCRQQYAEYARVAWLSASTVNYQIETPEQKSPNAAQI